MEITAEDFARRLRAARAWAGMSQAELSQALAAMDPPTAMPASAMTIKRLESPSKSTLVAGDREEFAREIADLTGAPLWFMLYGFGYAEGAGDVGDVLDSMEALKLAAAAHEATIAALVGGQFASPDLATAAEQSAAAAPTPGQLRAVPSAPKKRAPKE